MKPLSLDSKLFRHSFNFSDSGITLRKLFAEPDRFIQFSQNCSDLFFDYSRQLIDNKTLDLLLELADKNRILEKYRAMTEGGIVNNTEKRPALHTLCRAKESSLSLFTEISEVKQKIKEFTRKVHDGEIASSTGKKFESLCVVGVGGSNLGTEFVIKALSYKKKYLEPHFIVACDPSEFKKITDLFNFETTLFVIISKSYTTREVMINEYLIKDELKKLNLAPEKHIVRVTSKKSPGDLDEFTVFHMFDSIGGRYSVSSAAGGLPISLVYGFDVFDEFLDGMNEMDEDCLDKVPYKNIALISALIDIWNFIYLNFSVLAIIPYSILLEKLPAHIQQLYMESNGKMISSDGEKLNHNTSMIIFGDTGTKSQHSFFQLFHQGRTLPVEFIGVLKPPVDCNYSFDEVLNHDELFANLLAQADALAFGRDSRQIEKVCKGNRPSTIITLNDLSPLSIGKLVAFYEARTIMAGFLWGINPFDQFGVETGKILADEKRNLIKNAVNKNIFPENNQSDIYYTKALAQRKNS